MPWVAATARFSGVVGTNTDTVHAATASTMISGASAGLDEDQSCTAATIASDIFYNMDVSDCGRFAY
jgi:hypothetical protein